LKSRERAMNTLYYKSKNTDLRLANHYASYRKAGGKKTITKILNVNE